MTTGMTAKLKSVNEGILFILTVQSVGATLSAGGFALFAMFGINF